MSAPGDDGSGGGTKLVIGKSPDGSVEFISLRPHGVTVYVAHKTLAAVIGACCRCRHPWLTTVAHRVLPSQPEQAVRLRAVSAKRERRRAHRGGHVTPRPAGCAGQGPAFPVRTVPSLPPPWPRHAAQQAQGTTRALSMLLACGAADCAAVVMPAVLVGCHLARAARIAGGGS